MRGEDVEEEAVLVAGDVARRRFKLRTRWTEVGRIQIGNPTTERFRLLCFNQINSILINAIEPM